MIVKLTLAGALLASGLGLVAPLAIAAHSSSGDICIATPTEEVPPDCDTTTPPPPLPAGTDAGSLPGADAAVGRALRLVGGHGYYQLCARLAANIWGRPRSGYYSAAVQWRHMVETGQARRGDRSPPVGALLFWDTGGVFGHVAVYIGGGQIVSNDIGDSVAGEGGVYQVPFERIESQWGSRYLGWSPPIYSTLE
ncbi:hypothetical protein HPO96_20800 [Kribbella sandramycini]|uniref:Peptidase C51 domain-containing protein n=1 Tax=Kribbella sandramycini TaxID=60450 RepID=A0A7Y4L1Q5_9ACTN|nr:CHAP domain-containing protein [Kribbella sandramycini]MBB6566659.1 hypothetical protein [Kribbella sandramycini]NOL42689.1 hypothetical protein [Kribbella sandramycini]